MKTSQTLVDARQGSFISVYCNFSDAADSKHVSSTTENEPLESNKFVTSEKEDNEISESSKPGLCKTDRVVEQITYTTHSQLFENEIQQRGVITHQQLQFTETGYHSETQSGSFEKQSESFEKRSQEQQEHLKNHAILSGSPLNMSASDTAVQESEYMIGVKYVC